MPNTRFIDLVANHALQRKGVRDEADPGEYGTPERSAFTKRLHGDLTNLHKSGQPMTGPQYREWEQMLSERAYKAAQESGELDDRRQMARKHAIGRDPNRTESQRGKAEARARALRRQQYDWTTNEIKQGPNKGRYP